MCRRLDASQQRADGVYIGSGGGRACPVLAVDGAVVGHARRRWG